MQPTLTEDLQQISKQRFSEWQKAISQMSSIDTDYGFEWVGKLLLVSDYAFEWALKIPGWLLDIDKLLTKEYQQLTTEITSLSSEVTFNTNQEFSEFQIKQWLRQQRHFYSIACAALQLSEKLSIQQVTKLQSLLARSLIEAAYAWLKQQFTTQYGVASSAQYPQQDLVILLMGKLGGGELNYSSDIDLIFCYPEEGETHSFGELEENKTRSIENQKYFLRLAQRLIALLHETTADGFVYRVDMRLRPYGESGSLVLSFDAMTDYYLEQGREWERFAMIKADYISQDQVAADTIKKIIIPFSFRRYIDFSVLDAIRQLKHKISREMQHRNLASDIKLGQGGIRELEFIVQSLQLISGGRNPQLQVRNWWHSLEVLTETGLIKIDGSERLRKAYEFLRRLENILQIQNNAQTQQLPEDNGTQQIIAIAMGFESWDLLLNELKSKRENVESFFGQLFQDPNEETEQDNELQKVELFLQGKQQEVLFEKPQASDQELLNLALHFKQNFISERLGQRGQKRLSQLVPHLLIQARKTCEPTEVLQRCFSLMQSIGKRTAYYELLAENLPLLEHLVILVSRSQWLLEQLKQYPSLLDELLFPANFGKILTKQDFQSHLQQSLLRIEPEHIEEQLMAIGRFKVASQFKVAAGFLNHRFHILEVTRQLTDVAELSIQALLRIAWREIVAKYGAPKGADLSELSNFLVLGYGKLGSHELGFGSDLDLVFLYRGQSNEMTNSDKPIEVSQFYTKITQRLVHYLNTRTQHGILYEVDTRLRPSGRSGLLVSEFSAFAEYQKNQAWTWEKQALVRARVVAGDEQLTTDYQQVRTELLYTDKNIEQEVVAMRDKMRANLDRSADQEWDIKQGKGGLVDIEFLVQYWILKLAQKGVELPDIYSNHFWLTWLEENAHLDANTSQELKIIYEQYQSLVNQKRLDTVAGIIDYQKIEASAAFVQQLWASTFAELAVQ